MSDHAQIHCDFLLLRGTVSSAEIFEFWRSPRGALCWREQGGRFDALPILIDLGLSVIKANHQIVPPVLASGDVFVLKSS